MRQIGVGICCGKYTYQRSGDSASAIQLGRIPSSAWQYSGNIAYCVYNTVTVPTEQYGQFNSISTQSIYSLLFPTIGQAYLLSGPPSPIGRTLIIARSVVSYRIKENGIFMQGNSNNDDFAANSLYVTFTRLLQRDNLYFADALYFG